MLTIDININSIINQDPLCLTIGNFDGVHNGHKFVFDKLITESKKLNIPSAVLSFDPHPRQFFEKNKQHFNIVTEDKKIKLIESLGIDIYYKLKFDNDVSSMSAEDFVNKFLVNSLKIKSLIIGENFRFGKNRNGDTGLLKELSLEKKFSVHIINYIKSDSLNMIYSSSNIRESIKKSEFKKVSELLGRPWTISGFVKQGDKRAREMNFPTANILAPNTIHPKNGVYAIKAIVDGEKYSGIANFGRRPTFDGKKILLEVNIFNFNKEIYDKELTVEFLEFIRNEINR